ncbi:intraflagellar transport protein 81 homolog [Diaphorina citri]|uniref:Intraflagellar transport protein 81 homolog n=1 Tax=Diaphorina citri TaxID=121845 RepID=A0A3Q0J1W9_DIACI|nr:intraflagellar transport protein 81 homolog [Diaphorina citri]
MHSAVKYIVNELNKPPYNKRFNIVSFDSLSSEDLLQVVSDVLGELDASHKVDLRIEVPEQTIVRILSFLRVLKYRPNSEISPQVFRQGLLNGDKHIIHPILEWLLKNTKDLQKRAYLGKYLVKLEIPNEILTDVDIYNIYEQYESLVENFKAVHKESEAIENSGVNINELRNDLMAMENERDIVIKRLEQMSRKPKALEALTSVSSGKCIPHDTDNREELTAFIAQVSNSIATHKNRMMPLLEELRPLREEAANVSAEYEEVKKNYDRTSAILETGAEKLSQEVSSLREEKLSTELEIGLLASKAQIARVEIQRSSGDTGKAMKEAVMQRIQEREKVGRALKEQHKQMKDSQEQSVRQKLLWTNLLRYV